MWHIILTYGTKMYPRASSVEAGRLVRMLSQWSTLEGKERNEIILRLL